MDIRERETHEIEAYEAELRDMNVDDESLKISSYSIKRYSAPLKTKRLPVDMLFKILGPVTGLHILDCGCGDGEFSTIIGLLGGTVTGVDISERLIGIARRRAEVNGISERVQFLSCSIHDLPFPSGSFDGAFGKGVLHHIDIDAAAKEISRTLKQNGRAVFEEPIALSDTLQKIRRSGPVQIFVKENRITPDEQPLTMRDINSFSAFFQRTEVHSLQLFSRLERIFRSARALDRLNDFDNRMMRSFPALRKYGRLAILEYTK